MNTHHAFFPNEAGPGVGLVRIPINGTALEGNLVIPRGAEAVVLFAHGSGSSRFSPRNRFVAGILNRTHLGTLLIDLLTPEEEKIDMRTRELRFDIDLLGERLVSVTDWLTQSKDTDGLNIGLFGASTGAAAALMAAAKRPQYIGAVVSRGGRPDLAGPTLPQVEAPTLLLVGGYDTQVITLNERAMMSLNSVKKLVIVPHATHLFEEPGALEEVAEYARNWFVDYLLRQVPG